MEYSEEELKKLVRDIVGEEIAKALEPSALDKTMGQLAAWQFATLYPRSIPSGQKSGVGTSGADKGDEKCGGAVGGL